MAEDPVVAKCGLFGLLILLGSKIDGDLAGKAGRRSDNALMIFFKNIQIHPWLVIETLGEAPGHDADQVVIACGGGGIPVLAQDNKLQGASAVIEKDLAAGKLADTLDADRLVILTSVDKVCLNYGKEDEKPLDTMTVDEAKKYLAAGEFDEGTMAPKIEAAIDFIGDSAIRSVLITKLNKEGKTVSGGMGTLITK